MKKVHFIGICGAGMSAVAKLLIEKSLTVSGSDEGFYPPISDYLIENNIPCVKGYKKENIDESVDTVVIGKHAKLTVEENEEVAYAFQLRDEGKINILSFPEVLGQVTENRENILCVGSFGKSTTTSLLAHILEQNKLDVGYFIGAAPFTPKTNAHIGTHKNFILEGDEYPSSNWDNSSKFLHLNAHDILLTALAHDHVNVFKTHAEYKQAFYDLINQLVVKSYLDENYIDKCNLVVCYDDPSIQKECNGIKSTLLSGDVQLTTYSLEDESCNYYAKNIHYGETTTFDFHSSLAFNGIKLGTLETSLLGKHNIQNIVGVCAMILEKKLLTFEQIKEGVKSFKGVKRRLDLLTDESKKIKIYEGFGSSYEKARAAIEAINLHFPNKNIVILFEPHTFSWRNIDALSWYDDVFKEASKVFVYEPPTHGVGTHNQSTQEMIVERIIKGNTERNSSQKVSAIKGKESGLQTILDALDYQNDIVLILSSGDMDGIIKELPKLVN